MLLPLLGPLFLPIMGEIESHPIYFISNVKLTSNDPFYKAYNFM